MIHQKLQHPSHRLFTEVIRRVCEDQVEAGLVRDRPGEQCPFDRLCPDADFWQSQVDDVLANDGDRHAVGLDQKDARGSAGGCLQAECPRTGLQIKNILAAHTIPVPQPGEQPPAHPAT